MPKNPSNDVQYCDTILSSLDMSRSLLEFKCCMREYTQASYAPPSCWNSPVKGTLPLWQASSIFLTP